MSDQGLVQFRTFSGILARGSHQSPVTFHAKIDETGEAVVEFENIAVNASTRFILEDWHRDNELQYFSLKGMSDQGVSFETEHLFFSSMTFPAGEAQGAHYELKVRCASVTFRWDATEAVEQPMLMTYLRGFEGNCGLHCSCPLGAVAMAGTFSSPNPNHLMGRLMIRAETAPADAAAWRGDADRLLEHVRRVMSFVAGSFLRAPVKEFRIGRSVEVAVLSQTAQRREELPVFHPVARTRIFQSAVQSYFNPAIEVRNLNFALEWFTMEATYNEVRLVSAMTALENLINSNLSRRDRRHVRETSFRRLEDALRALIDRFAIDSEEGKTDPALASDIASKLLELNNRTLKNKFRRLIYRWRVPLDGIDDALIEAAFTARNQIVHRGQYYEDGRDKPDLWEHVTVVREILTRMFLTVLSFKGPYVSYLGGYHSAVFPPTGETEGGQ